jgi:hypothetical protein
MRTKSRKLAHYDRIIAKLQQKLLTRYSSETIHRIVLKTHKRNQLRPANFNAASIPEFDRLVEEVIRYISRSTESGYREFFSKSISSIEEAPNDTVLKTSTQRHDFASFRPERLRKFTMQIRISHWNYPPNRVVVFLLELQNCNLASLGPESQAFPQERVLK